MTRGYWASLDHSDEWHDADGYEDDYRPEPEGAGRLPRTHRGMPYDGDDPEGEQERRDDMRRERYEGSAWADEPPC